MSEPDYRAMWEELRRNLEHIRAGSLDVDVLRGYLEELEETRKGAPAPDPDYTPAARRVEAWASSGSAKLYEEREHAYAHAAACLTARAWARRGPGRRMTYADWRNHWPDSRLDRLATWLRHRDEKEGYR